MDITGQYIIPFVVMGVTGFVSTVLAIAMTIMVKVRNKRQQRNCADDDDEAHREIDIEIEEDVQLRHPASYK